MLRNDLITKLSEFDNDCVTVDVAGTMVDVVSARRDRDGIVLVPDPDELRDALDRHAGRTVR